MQYPVVFNHVCVSVPDIEKAIEFYKEVFGWYHISGPMLLKRDGPAGPFCETVYGKDWTEFKLAHMSTGNGIGFELVEFAGSYAPENNFEMKRHGIFHFAITMPDYEEFIEKVIAHGGKQHSPANVSEVDGEKWVAVFVEDPFGNVFEIYAHSYERNCIRK